MVQSEPRHNLCAYFEDNKNKIFREFANGGLLSQLQQDFKQLIDDCVLQIWSMTVKAQNTVVIAIGGYGREELFPHSDASLLILTLNPDDTIQKLHLENFIKLCGDIGLKINLTVKNIVDCLKSAAQDIFFQTSLLDVRFLGGDRDVFDSFTQQVQSAIDPQAFFYARRKEMQQRYLQYQETPYALEPSCKESPGGLRDLEVVLWVSRVTGLGTTWQSLVGENLLTAYELRELLRNQKLLQRIRAHLHLLANQKQDILLFDLQPLLAERLGFLYGDQRQNSEQLMHEYYLAAKRVTQINAILMLEMEALLFPKELQIARAINADFYERQGLIEIARDNLFQVYPEKILETFLIYIETPDIRGLSATTLRALYLARNKMDANWRSDVRNHACFLRIMQQASVSVGDTLKLMNQTGVLGRYLLNFRQVLGKMPHDSFHVYTVDQHILTVIQNLNRLGMPERTHGHSFCSELFSNFAKPWILMIAALFHGGAQGHCGDRSFLNSNEAKQFCDQHGLDKEDSDLIIWLVKHHLMMNSLAEESGVIDPNTILQFAKIIKSERYLTALYLLAVAGMRSSDLNKSNLGGNKLLETLYQNILHVLGGVNANADQSAILEQRKQEALAKLQLYGLSSQNHLAFWEHLDVSFFLRYSAEQVAWLTRHLWDKVNDEHPIVKAHLSFFGEGIEVVVYTRDRPKLFGLLCGYFMQQNLTILEAGVYTTRHGYALDVFYLAAVDLNLPSLTDYRSLLNLIEKSLTELLMQPSALLANTKEVFVGYRQRVLIKPQVKLRPDEQAKYFLLSLSASDHAGLLYRVAQVLAKHNIQLRTARITTVGEKVEDVFVLEGDALAENSALQAEVEADLLKVLAVS